MDDLISRQAAIDCVNHMRFGMDKMAFGIVTTALLELPSAQPEHERWIEHHYAGGMYFTCSICNHNGAGRFCSNCGARMTDKEKDDEQTD